MTHDHDLDADLWTGSGGDGRPCPRCGRPVVRNRFRSHLFEGMHLACHHYEYEHDGDPDVACGDPTCPARAFDPNPMPAWM